MLSLEALQDKNLREDLATKYLRIRNYTEWICRNLEVEDCVVQTQLEVSPPKWHLAHTTWFFEEMILSVFKKNYKKFDDSFHDLFNSYYQSLGKFWFQGDRGSLSRPTYKEILTYRSWVDEAILSLLDSLENSEDVKNLMRIALHHEQQHQELLYMDIKSILAHNPSAPAYSVESYVVNEERKSSWKSFPEGIYQVGDEGKGFCYDHEGPRHKVYQYAFAIQNAYVSNRDFQSFIEDGAYQNPKLWLNDAWDWVCKYSIKHPLYWIKIDHGWNEYTLYGKIELDLKAPVSHVSYYEAEAFARWSGYRLPTEFEFEIFLESEPFTPADKTVLHPRSEGSAQLWCWTQSHFSAYPKFKAFEGSLQEYNSKFMCHQFVLRGGCVVTSQDHYRHTYRNFFKANQRWMFSGIRLAKDL